MAIIIAINTVAITDIAPDAPSPCFQHFKLFSAISLPHTALF